MEVGAGACNDCDSLAAGEEGLALALVDRVEGSLLAGMGGRGRGGGQARNNKRGD